MQLLGANALRLQQHLTPEVRIFMAFIETTTLKPVIQQR